MSIFIPAPGDEPVGLAFDGIWLWCGDIGDHLVYKLEPADGKILDSAELPDEGELVDLAYAYGEILALMDNRRLFRLSVFAPAVEVATLDSAEGISFDGQTYLLSKESSVLKRRKLSNFATFMASSITSNCDFLAANGSLVYRHCGVTGSPGNYVHVVELHDAVNASSASLEGSIEFTLDSGLATGIEVASFDGKLTMWVVGRGYGQQSRHVTAFLLH